MNELDYRSGASDQARTRRLDRCAFASTVIACPVVHWPLVAGMYWVADSLPGSVSIWTLLPIFAAPVFLAVGLVAWAGATGGDARPPRRLFGAAAAVLWVTIIVDLGVLLILR